jgi:hypothetical protein
VLTKEYPEEYIIYLIYLKVIPNNFWDIEKSIP